MSKDLFRKIRNLEAELSPKQKILAPYFLAHLEELPFQTTSEIASKTGVSEPTVIRFARLLGFKGFVEFKDELQRIVLEKYGPFERLRKIKKINKELEEIVGMVFEREMHNLRETQRRLNIPDIEEIAHEVIRGEKKYVIGLRTSSACAHLLGRLLSHIMPNVITILDGDIRMFEGLRSVSKQDVLITISYPRYTKATAEAVQFAIDRKATTIAITDSGLSPTAQISKFTIVAPSNSITFSNSYTACLSVINLLTTVIANINKRQSEAVLKEWDKALEPFNFFYRK